jgi:hypothetical protein
MVTDSELGKSGREVFRVTREEISMNAVKRAIDLHTRKPRNQYGMHRTMADTVIAHQKSDISVLEEVLLMSYERRISLWVCIGRSPASTGLDDYGTHHTLGPSPGSTGSLGGTYRYAVSVGEYGVD